MQIKQSLLKTGVFEDNVYCHLVSGLGAGFFAVCFGSPVDVVKSRLMGIISFSMKGSVQIVNAMRRSLCQSKTSCSHFP